jgi:hypothetical protein
VQRGLIQRRPFAADELASAFGLTAFDRDRNSAGLHGRVRGNDLVDAMRFPARVMLWAIDFIAESGDRNAVNGVYRRPADDFATVVGFVA